MKPTLNAPSFLKCLLPGLLISLLVLNSHALPTSASQQSVATPGSGLVEFEVRASITTGKKSKSALGNKSVPAKPTPAKKSSGKKPAPLKTAPPKKAPGKAPAPPKPAPGKQSQLTKGSHAKVPGGGALARKNSKASLTKGARKTCPVKKPGKKMVKRSLYRRQVPPTVHPLGNSPHPITLFHGSDEEDEAISAQKVKLKETSKYGDLHAPGEGCSGGFYLTDSLFAAAQFVCHSKSWETPNEFAFVNEYTWTAPPGLKHRRYLQANEITRWDASEDCQIYDMLEAPMYDPIADVDLHKDFWQYVIVNQEATAGLQFENRYVIPCMNVESGRDQVGPEVYQKGQKTNPEFTEFAAELQQC
ncbi:hypothetical protein NMY22_g12702 [Coprinellus aureogranulatus]|nr:hypothetical protein NMY22_g12702 [Coprinellus aureogranulatus]